ncbi:MAG TPA: hypothetical protein VM890_13200, partial [Longimicrobium sp.]|nr:hypothetical protein [Longimicrobium sp.]
MPAMNTSHESSRESRQPREREVDLRILRSPAAETPDRVVEHKYVSLSGVKHFVERRTHAFDHR